VHLFSQYMIHKLPVQPGPYFKLNMINTSSFSKFFLLRIIARNNQFSLYSTESTVLFCHLCTMKPSYFAKWKSLQTYVVVNQASQSNCFVTARYFQNGCFSSHVNTSTTFNHIKYEKTDSTLLPSVPKTSERMLLFGRFPGFARLYFWWEQLVGEDEYGVLVGRYWPWEHETLGAKPFPMPLCPQQFSRKSDLGTSPGLSGDKPATNRLTHFRQTWIVFRDSVRTTQ